MMKCSHCKASVKDRKALMSHRWKRHRSLMHAGRRKAVPTTTGSALRAGGPAALDAIIQIFRKLPNNITLGTARLMLNSTASALKIQNPLK